MCVFKLCLLLKLIEQNEHEYFFSLPQSWYKWAVIVFEFLYHFLQLGQHAPVLPKKISNYHTQISVNKLTVNKQLGWVSSEMRMNAFLGFISWIYVYGTPRSEIEAVYRTRSVNDGCKPYSWNRNLKTKRLDECGNTVKVTRSVSKIFEN